MGLKRTHRSGPKFGRPQKPICKKAKTRNYKMSENLQFSSVIFENFQHFLFTFYINVKIKLTNTIQYSEPSIAEIDMTSSGSGCEHYLTINSFNNNQNKGGATGWTGVEMSTPLSLGRYSFVSKNNVKIVRYTFWQLISFPPHFFWAALLNQKKSKKL